MAGQVAVDVVDVSKRFRLYREKLTSVKDRVLRMGRNPYVDFWALRDVSFTVDEGETVGILGRNGSGKSTLLKCVSGILQPTHGHVAVRGQLAALLELGAGFQPELSGRDNIYLNASLLGLSSKEVERRFDQIVAFAELEQFIDNQVKYYSSGMFVRLGFAVAVNVDPDVLVVDEVLAVGDENFQRKCLARIKQFQEEGRTILFVTHAADLVRQICDRAVVLADSRVLAVGTAGEAISAYHEYLAAIGVAEAELGPSDARPELVQDRPVEITNVALEHTGSGVRPYVEPHDRLTVRIDYEAREAVPGIVFSYAFYFQGGGLIHASDTAILEKTFDAPAGRGQVAFTFPDVPLLEGSYMIHVAISSATGLVYDLREQDAMFEVTNPGRSRGSVDLQPEVEISVATPS
ncbi:MAG TPA: ABC transporter ATP-binding protein [Acidimicrobiales bacterium]|nr:ABC transporter ATP-binding protein [Acidimicrobiales bacterium]